MKIPEKIFKKDIKIIKVMLKYKLWRNTTDKTYKWNCLLKKLALNHKKPIPYLIIKEDKDIIPFYNHNPFLSLIFLNKYSVISLLHEFSHHIGLNEFESIEYSEKVFFAAYKPARRLKRDERGFLIKEK